MKTFFNKTNIHLSSAGTRMHRQRGYNLIEVMVAALILSTAILGLAGLQMMGMKGTQQSLMKQQAMGLVHNIIERMRANQNGVVNGDYAFTSVAYDCTQMLPNCSTVNCNSADIALTDKLNLVCGIHPGGGDDTGGINSMDNPILVNGQLNVACVGACAGGNMTITVGWDERVIGKEVVVLDAVTGTSDTLSINTKVVASP